MIKKLLIIVSILFAFHYMVFAQNGNVKPLTIGEIRTLKSEIFEEKNCEIIFKNHYKNRIIKSHKVAQSKALGEAQ